MQQADAVDELVAVAERLGAAGVFRAAPRRTAASSFPADHPLYGQTLPLWAPDIARRLAEFDVLLVAGMDLMREYVYHGPEPAIPRHVRLVHFDEDPRELGKNFPAEVGVLGDTRSGLGRARRLAGRADGRDAARARRPSAAAAAGRCTAASARNCASKSPAAATPGP